MEQKILKIINKGVVFLKNEQEKNDYFGFETIFPTILVFDCLNEINSDKSDLIKEKIKKTLLQEKNEFWAFNYWRRNSLKNLKEPYPDDLDDTSLALSALYRFDNKILKGDDLAKIINLLVLSEEKEGGPYRTWILPKEKSKKWDDVDVAVNSNIGYFLKLQKIKLKSLNKLVENRIIEDNLNSPFYKGELPVIYFISRFYRGKLKDKLRQKLINKAKGCDSTLDMALIVSSLIRLGYKDEIKTEWINNILKKQFKNGAWVKEDFYFYIDKIKQTNFIGGESMSTAFIVESLALYQNSQTKIKDGLFLGINEFKKRVVLGVKNTFNKYPESLKAEILSFINKVADNDKTGIVIATPLVVLNSLEPKLKKKIPTKLINKLGEINLLGWCAYTIYDNIIDGDSPKEQVSIANIICREMDLAFNNLPINKKTGYFEFYKSLMQKMEISNWYEQKYLRLEDKKDIKITKFDLEQIANKSIGHALTSVAILCYLKYSVKSPEIKTLMSYFKYFIIAKQMNDDVHDWLEDLEKGQINSANYKLIKYLESKNKNIFEEIKDKEGLKVVFWQNIIPDYCNEIIRITKTAERMINKSKIIINKQYLLELNNKNLESGKLALEERTKTLEFIKTYYT